MYLYETHVHTSPLSACAKVGVRETLEFYKSAGYAGFPMRKRLNAILPYMTRLCLSQRR